MKLGECLVFYLKYYPEMNKLYREEEEVTSLPEAHDTKEKASKVGKAADEEAAAFLEGCAQVIETYYAEIGNPNIANYGCLEKKSEIERDWSISVAVWPRTKIKQEKMKVGVTIAGMESGKPEIVPWVWCRGVDDPHHAFVTYLQAVGKAKGTWVDHGLQEGAVALGRIPILLPVDGFVIETEPLLDSVKEAIQRIDQGELVNWFPR